jgi:hypothetical protein
MSSSPSPAAGSIDTKKGIADAIRRAATGLGVADETDDAVRTL